MVTDYADQFIAALKQMRAEGVTHGVFGDIDFNPHREWDENVCKAADIELMLPLWLREHKKVARDFIDAGFQTVIVATRSDLLGEEWLGRQFDQQFLQDLAEFPDISPCGEAGEFHSLGGGRAALQEENGYPGVFKYKTPGPLVPGYSEMRFGGKVSWCRSITCEMIKHGV